MKKITLLGYLFLGFSLAVFGQVVETEMRMSDGVQPALEVDLQGDSKTSEKIWKKFAKKVGKVDWDRKNKEHVLFNVVVPDIDREYPVTVITKFSSSKDVTKGTFWFKVDGDYLNSDADGDELKGAGNWIQEFAYEVERNAISDNLEKEEKQLKNLNKDFEKLEKQNEKLHKTIEKAKESIKKAEQGIEENEKDQKSKKSEIETQKKQLDVVKAALENIGKGKS